MERVVAPGVFSESYRECFFGMRAQSFRYFYFSITLHAKNFVDIVARICFYSTCVFTISLSL